MPYNRETPPIVLKLHAEHSHNISQHSTTSAQHSIASSQHGTTWHPDRYIIYAQHKFPCTPTNSWFVASNCCCECVFNVAQVFLFAFKVLSICLVLLNILWVCPTYATEMAGTFLQSWRRVITVITVIALFKFCLLGFMFWIGLERFLLKLAWYFGIVVQGRNYPW